ncbi:MAG TPA: hypothetical protein VFO41_02145 [Alphaproteobacteria bacterium]|nr:hypothetical protein [Alphaproteobacteria bacterium]
MMDTEAYEFATGIPTHEAALRMLERFPRPNQIGERVGFLRQIGFPEIRAREVEYHYWPATRGEAVRPIAPPKAIPQRRRQPPPLLRQFVDLVRGVF